MSRTYKIVLWTVLGLGILIPSGIVGVIQLELRRMRDVAASRFPGDTVEGLIATVECGNCRMQDRNRAVWALGQMEAEPALETLKARVDGQSCDHATRLCQHELAKAIRLIETREQRAGFWWGIVRRLHRV